MAITQTTSSPFPQDVLQDLTQLALLVRDHIASIKEPQTLLDIVSVYEQRQVEMGNAGRVAFMGPTGTEMGANLFHK